MTDDLKLKVEWYEEVLRMIAEDRVPLSTKLYVPTHVRVARFARAALEGGSFDIQDPPDTEDAGRLRPPVRTRRKS